MKIISPLIDRVRAWYTTSRAIVGRQLTTALNWSRRYRLILLRAAFTGAALALSLTLSLVLWRRSPHFRATLRTLPILALHRSRVILADLRTTPQPARRVTTAGVKPLPAEEVPATPQPNGQL